MLPEDAWVKIFARLSLRNIARFRSVSKEWKSMIDSDFFRDLYESINSSPSSVSWSIMNRMITTLSVEIVGHHGCKRWGLTNSLGSSLITSYNPETTTTLRKTSVLSCTDGIVLLYTEDSQGAPMYHVGNPLLRQWTRIPLPPHLSAFDVVRLQENRLFSDTGLVTKMEKGIAVGYKVVWILASCIVSRQLTFMVYSSETGLWKTKIVRIASNMLWSRVKYSVTLNGILYWLGSASNTIDASHVVSYDLFHNDDLDDECNINLFPGQKFLSCQLFKRTITTSGGFVMYCNVFSDNGGRTIRVWRLISTKDHPKSWKLTWKLNTKSSLKRFGADYFPVVMHPLNPNIIYLWSRNKDALVLLNLRTRKFSLRKDAEKKSKSMDGCNMRFSGCKEYMDLVYPLFYNDFHSTTSTFHSA